MDIKQIIMEYYKPLQAHKFDNLDKIDHFLKDTIFQNSHKKKQQTISIGLYRFKFNNQASKKQNKKIPGPDGFIVEFQQTFKGRTVSIAKIFQMIEIDGIIPNLFYEANITLISKPDSHVIIFHIDYKFIKVDTKG